MKPLRQAVEEYFVMRRGLGFKLRLAGPALLDFASFLEHQSSDHITNTLALRWAMQRGDCQPALWASRLGFVRVFARHHKASDPRTEIPPGAVQQLSGRDPLVEKLAKPHIDRMEYPSLYADDRSEARVKARIADELRALQADKSNVPGASDNADETADSVASP